MNLWPRFGSDWTSSDSGNLGFLVTGFGKCGGDRWFLGVRKNVWCFLGLFLFVLRVLTLFLILECFDSEKGERRAAEMFVERDGPGFDFRVKS